jgi:hypothetical protein
LTDTPTDPFTARPLLLKTLDDGVVIYSTGPDHTDDGGKLTDGAPKPGTDIGVRLFDPKHRRKKAEEPAP